MKLKESVIPGINERTEDNKQEIEEKKDYRGKPISKVFKQLGGLYFYECPAGWISQDTNIIISLLTAEETPPKIFPGTWLDQPHWYVEAKQIYNIAKNKWQQNQQNQQKA